jgi:hypothetical protein
MHRKAAGPSRIGALLWCADTTTRTRCHVQVRQGVARLHDLVTGRKVSCDLVGRKSFRFCRDGLHVWRAFRAVSRGCAQGWESLLNRWDKLEIEVKPENRNMRLLALHCVPSGWRFVAHDSHKVRGDCDAVDSGYGAVTEEKE